MRPIDFFTPVHYGSRANNLEEKAIQYIDDYFHLGGPKAVVIGKAEDGTEKVVLCPSKCSPKTILKTIGVALSWFTVVIPLGMLIAKAALRSSHKYSISESSKISSAPTKSLLQNHEITGPKKNQNTQLENAALVFQKHIRGFNVRQPLKAAGIYPDYSPELIRINFLGWNLINEIINNPRSQNFETIFKGIEASGYKHEKLSALIKLIRFDKYQGVHEIRAQLRENLVKPQSLFECLDSLTIPTIKEIQALTSLEEFLHFSLADVKFLAKNALGLRHVSSRQQALSEGVFGFHNGCSLALVPQKDPVHTPWNAMYKNRKIEFTDEDVGDFECQVDGFIKQCLVYDANNEVPGAIIQLGHSQYQDLVQLLDICCFSMLDYKDNRPFIEDFELWGNGLGRFPKQNLNGDKINALPYLNRTVLGILNQFPDKILQTKEEVEAIYNNMINAYRTEIIQAVRELNYQKTLAKS